MTEESKSNPVEKKRLEITDNLLKSISSVDVAIIIFDKHQSCFTVNIAELKDCRNSAENASLPDWSETLTNWVIEQIEQLEVNEKLHIQNTAAISNFKIFKFTKFNDVECSIGIIFNERTSDRLQELLPKMQQPDCLTEQNPIDNHNLPAKKLLIEIEALQQELQKLRQEKLALEAILDTAIEQAHLNESQLQKTIQEQQKAYAIILEINQELETLIYTDSLTQIANRRHFDDYLKEEWQKSSLRLTFLSLILCDIDYFKVYNDTYGHLIGDYCLQQIALTLESIAESYGGLAARYGGEEFGIILPNTEKERALEIANKMRSTVRSLRIEHQNSPVYRYVTLSLGIYSLIPSSNSTPELAIAMADKALYEAKEQGRDRAWTYRD